MRILVLSLEPWRDDTGGGNVLSNILANVDAEYSQIYCSQGSPQNTLCRQYFQLSPAQVMVSALTRHPVGRDFTATSQPEQTPAAPAASPALYQRLFRLGQRLRWDSLYVAEEAAWKRGNWKTDALEAFVRRADPDLVFAPCYGSNFMLALTRHVASLTNCPIVSYISDDHYSLRQFRVSPVFWARRYVLRRGLRRTFPLYQEMFTMTEEQQAELERAFGSAPIVLRKAAVPLTQEPRRAGDRPGPLRFVYAGGLYLGRWKTLRAIARAIGALNDAGQPARLDIYSGTTLTPRQRGAITRCPGVTIHGLVSQERLKQVYQEADVALHVESFSPRFRGATRLSFSTKVVDCLASGCAIMAVGPREQAGVRYLARERAALCITSLRGVRPAVERLASERGLVDELAAGARRCLERNHDPERTTQTVRAVFEHAVRVG